MSLATQSHNTLVGKVALITGGGTGIGRAIAKAFIAEGAKVFVTGRRPDPLRSLAEEHSDQVAWTSADIGKPEDVKRIVVDTLAQFGQLDILVNNAATFAMIPLAELDDDTIDQSLRVNLTSTWRLSREALKPLINTRGQIINVSSTLAGAPGPGLLAYGSTKAAINYATKVLAAELGPMGVRVNAISPGATVTEGTAGVSEDMRNMIITQTPFGRLGQPEDIASAVALLARNEASWITGQVLGVSGGLHL